MRARLRLSVVTFTSAVMAGGLFAGTTSPAPRSVDTAADRPQTVRVADHVTVLEDRLASLRVAASRQKSREAIRVWPAAGGHTGWWGESRGGRAHVGIDIDGDTGDRIVAAARGTIVHAGAAVTGYGGYGLMVIVEHGAFATLYAHLSSVDVSVGQVVEAGEPIGLMGTTGNVTGSHLHFEVRVAGAPVDPAPFMPAPIRRPAQSGVVDPPERQYSPSARLRNPSSTR